MINTPRPIKGLWVRPTTVATAVPRYGPIYGIKSVIPQNKPNNKADFKPIILKPIVSQTNTIQATNKVPLTHFLTSKPIFSTNDATSTWCFVGITLRSKFVTLSKSNNMYKPIIKPKNIVPKPLTKFDIILTIVVGKLLEILVPYIVIASKILVLTASISKASVSNLSNILFIKSVILLNILGNVLINSFNSL